MLERKRKSRLIKVEEEIDILETKIKQLGDELMKEENATDYEKVMEITSEIEENNEKLEMLYKEWEQLSK